MTQPRLGGQLSCQSTDAFFSWGRPPLDCRVPGNTALAIKRNFFLLDLVSNTATFADMQGCLRSPGERGGLPRTHGREGAARGSSLLTPLLSCCCPAGSQVGWLDMHTLPQTLMDHTSYPGADAGLCLSDQSACTVYRWVHAPWRDTWRVGSAPSPRGTLCVVLTAPVVREPLVTSRLSPDWMGSSKPSLSLLPSPIHPQGFSQNRAHSGCSVSVCQIREKRGLRICGAVAHFICMDGVLPVSAPYSMINGESHLLHY